MRAQKPIVVIGSINMDLIAQVQRLPTAGETILGGDLLLAAGGKGANQSVAAARLCGESRRVFHVGCVGDDHYGKQLRAGLVENGVDCRFVRKVRGVASGTAIILLQTSGENSIVVLPGANRFVSPKDIDAAKAVIADAFAVVMQLEIPAATVRYAIRLCRKLGVMTILDPAPMSAEGLTGDLLAADVVTPNESEFESIGHGEFKLVVMKCGKRGARILQAGSKPKTVPGFKVKVIDTTAAGDAFTAGLTVALAEGKQLDQAVRFANAAGALACTIVGAQPSLPWRKDVDRLLRAAP